ncbi:hypothetical protein CDL15_Pgr028530 [Punica granatum]|nr:hypothetical protein CDL15_Pgr028530 [Punica granatum]
MATRVLHVSMLAIISLFAMEAQAALRYTVTNNAGTTPGGMRFTNQIGIPYTRQTLASATNFIWQTFRQASAADRKSVQQVSLFIDNVGGVAYTSGDQIHVSASYLAGYSGDVKSEFTGVVYHEMAHVWQSNGAGQAPGGLIEGIADFVRLKSGYVPGHWVKPGQGDRWDQGYDVTARFLNYCDGLRNGFVAELNKKMRTGYNVSFFAELLGKSVDQLWSDYKAKYAQ